MSAAAVIIIAVIIPLFIEIFLIKFKEEREEGNVGKCVFPAGFVEASSGKLRRLRWCCAL